MQGRDASQQTAPIPLIRSTKNWPGATITFGRRCVAPILFDIIQNFPELTLEISFNDRRVDLVEEGIDLAIRMGELEDRSGLIARRLRSAQPSAQLPPIWSDTVRPTKSTTWLATPDRLWARWICHALDLDGRQRTTSKIHAAQPHHPRPWRTCAGCRACRMRPCLSANLTSEHLKRGELQIVLSGSFVESTSMHALWPVTRNLAPKVRVVVDALVERFTSSAPGQVP